MHYEVGQFIKRIRKELPHKFRLRDVIEVGSKWINGSPRKYFWLCRYIGVDLSVGKGVDIIGNFNDVNIPLDWFDVCISTECLEHDNQWMMTLRKMYDVLKPGGLMIMTCAGPDRTEHGTTRMNPECSPDTTDYYRNISTRDFKSVLPSDLFDLYVLMYARGKNDLQFYGIKKYK